MLPSTTARVAVFSMKTPESIFSRSRPEPRTTRPRTTASGADTVMTLPLPGPRTTAPGSPSSVSLRAILTLGAMLARPQDDDVAFGGAVEHRLQVRLARRYDDAFRPGRQGEAGGEAAPPTPGARWCERRSIAQTFFGSTSMRPCISMCIAWQNQVQ